MIEKRLCAIQDIAVGRSSSKGASCKTQRGERELIANLFWCGAASTGNAALTSSSFRAFRAIRQADTLHA
jgi:hypothetical protein